MVASADDARAGIALAHAHDAGRCGFVIVSARPTDEPATPPDSSLTPLANLVRIEGVAADTVRDLLRHRWFAPSFEMAAAAAHATGDPITTPDGTIFEGPSIVHGGGKAKARGILATRGEIKELQTRIVAEEDEVTRCNAEVSKHAGIAKRAETELKTLQSREHNSEKELLELELRMLRLDEELVRFDNKRVVIENERHQTEAERDGLHARQAEARESIARLEVEQRTADDLFMSSQRKLLEARESRPDDYRVAGALGLAALLEENLNEAYDFFKRSIELHFDNEAILRHLIATGEKLNRLRDIEEEVKKFAEFAPGNLDMGLTYAALLSKLGNDIEAREKLDTILMLSPGHEQAKNLLDEIDGRGVTAP